MPLAFLNDPELAQKVLSAVLVFFATTVVSFLAGRWWGKYQARKQWERKLFLDRIIVSLNSFADGWLKIRTIFERSLEESFLNPVAIEKVRTAAAQTTADDPMLPIAPADRWYLLNFVLNAVAERFTGGLMRYDAGQPLRPVTYLLFLTCEVLGEDRIHKVRAMLLRKDLVDDFPYGDGLPRLEREWHRDRIATLRRAVERYRKEPDNFLPVEVYV